MLLGNSIYAMVPFIFTVPETVDVPVPTNYRLQSPIRLHLLTLTQLVGSFSLSIWLVWITLMMIQMPVLGFLLILGQLNTFPVSLFFMCITRHGSPVCCF